MPGQFLSPDGDLESAFVSDPAIIDQFAKTGSLWAWGYNYSGTIGDGTNYTNEAYKSTPIQVAGTTWKQVSMNNSAAAIKTDGTLWVWGTNNLGELGDNTLNSKSSPVQTVAGGNNWKLVYSGRYSKAAIKTDSTLWMWGHGNYGQLGDGTTVSKSSPVQIAGTNWKMVSAGVYFSAAIKTDGTLWSWGRNNYSQLGNGDNTNRSSPVQTISSGTNWKSMATGGYHSAAIKTDGTLWTWGRNTEGQLGDGTTTERNSPVQISGTTWKLLAAGKYCTAAIKTDGTLWTWGQAQQGLLGDGTTANKSSPVQIKGNNWKMVSCAAYHMLAIHFYDAGNLYP